MAGACQILTDRVVVECSVLPEVLLVRITLAFNLPMVDPISVPSRAWALHRSRVGGGK